MAKIALIGPVYPYRGGIAHYTTLLDRTLRSAGHSSLLISFRRQYPTWLFPGRSDKDPSAEPLATDDANYWIDSINPLTWLQTFRKLHSFNPDLIILQWWSTFWSPVWIALMMLNRLFLRSPVLIICHNVLPHERRRFDVALAKRTLRMATYLIVQSDEERQRLQQLLPAASSTVVPHPVYDMFVHQSIERSEARALLDLPAESPILLFFGIVRPYKGLAELLRAFPAIRESVEDIRLVIAGEFWEDKRTYLALIDELGLGSAVLIDDRYIPNEEVAIYFSAADALAAPYRFKTGSGVAQMSNAFQLSVITPASASAQDEAADPFDQATGPKRRQEIATAVIAYFKSSDVAAQRKASLSTSAQETDPSWQHLIDSIEACFDCGSG
jgi:glycosyltransferase involved in cell wall biosynthesis